MNKRAAILVCLCLQLMLPSPAPAEGGAAPPEPVPAGSPSTVDFDLGSTARTISASDHLTAPVDILVGGATRTVSSGDLLTPAELVAVHQILASGAQAIQLGANGNALGGGFQLTPQLSSMMSALLVPQGVSALLDAASGPSFSLTGNLTNAGNFYAVSTSGQVTAATVSAANIVNTTGALLSTVAPQTALLGLTSAVANLDLVLHAVNDIVNAGVISSSGRLTATAGGSIINALPAGATGPQPVMQALGSIDLITARLTNTGLISSASANINLASQLVSAILVNNAGGRLDAAAGSVNVRDMLFSGKADFALTGGDVVASALNIHTGAGVARVNVGELTGTININAHEAHVSAATGNLTLGAIELGGDPTFHNTAGNVTISGNLIFAGQDLSIIAAGDITTSVSGLRIDTSSSLGNGGNVLMVAGANAVLSGATLELTQGPGSGGGSESGGKIDLATSPVSMFTTRGGLSSGTGNGGNVTLVAYAGSSADSGTVRLPAVSFSVFTGGRGSGTNGDFTVLAGAASGSATSISTGSVSTVGGAPGTGNIVLRTASPRIEGGSILVDAVTGAFSGGSFTAGETVAASLAAGNLTTPGSSIRVAAGANARLGSLSSVGSGSGSSGGVIDVLSNEVMDTALPFTVGGPAGCLNCTTGGLQATATTTGLAGDGGNIRVESRSSGGLKVTNPGFLAVPVLALNGNGGTIALKAPAGDIDLIGGTYAANGGGNGRGGTISFSGAALVNTQNSLPWTLSARGSGSGSGGTVSVAATGSAADLSFGSAAGQVVALAVQSGLSGGNGGQVSLKAGRNLTVSSTAITARPQATSGDGASYMLSAGAAGAGILLVNGTLDAAAAGSGRGGTIALAFNDAGGSFAIGQPLTGSGVTGDLLASAPGAGAGGSISVSNSAAAPLAVTSAGMVSAASAAGPAGTVTLSAPGNAVSLSSTGLLAGELVASGSSIAVQDQSTNGLSLRSLSASAGDIAVTSGGPITSGGVIAEQGSITLVAAGGTLRILPGSVLSSTEGDLTLISSDAASGSIAIGEGAALSASTTGETLGRVTIAIGGLPQSPVAGEAPAAVTVDTANGGRVFFGANGIEALPPTNTVSADGGAVVFDSGALPASAITLEGAVTVSSTADNPLQPLLLSSLDLTDPAVVSLVVELQTSGQVGGTLELTGGIASGGNVIVDPADLAPVLTAAYIPENVTLTLRGFSSGDRLNIELSPGSSSTQVVVAGVKEFVGAGEPSAGRVNITSTAAGPLLVIAGSGTLTSDGSLLIETAGAMAIAGTVSAGSLSLTAGGPDGSIALGGNVTAFASAHLHAAGSGGITRTSGMVTAPVVALSAPAGDIGTADYRIHTAAATLSAAAGGSVYLNQTGTVTLTDSQAGPVFFLKARGDITVAGSITADRVHLVATGRSHDILLDAGIMAGSLVQLRAGLSGNILQSSGLVSGDTVRLRTHDGDIGSAEAPVQVSAGKLKANATGDGEVYVENQQQSTGKQKPGRGARSCAASLVPISWTPSTAPLVAGETFVRHIVAGCAIRATLETRIVEVEAGLILLNHGEALISTDRPVRVVSGDAAITIEKGSHVLVSREEGLLTVTNLHERSFASVSVTLRPGYGTRLAAGQELMAAARAGRVEEARAADLVGRRTIKSCEVAGQFHLSTCEVSPVTLLTRNELLSSLLRSRHEPDRKLAAGVLKTAACLMVVTSRRGAYTAGNK